MIAEARGGDVVMKRHLPLGSGVHRQLEGLDSLHSLWLSESTLLRRLARVPEARMFAIYQVQQ